MDRKFYLLILLFIAMLLTLPGCDHSSAMQTLQTEEDESIATLDFIGDYQEGLRLAQKENKPMLVYFMAEDCVFSRQMSHETFTDSNFRKFSRNFICVRIDISASDAEKLCDELGISGTPTIQFMSPSGVALQRLTQPQPAKELVLQMQAVLYSIAWNEVRSYL